MPTAFPEVFEKLRDILRSHAGNLSVTADTPTYFCLSGGQHPTHKTPMPIMMVKVSKNYVAFHLMPVYGCPKLLDGISPKLKARMQGKSCFNFKTVDDALFKELHTLTGASLKAFKKAGFMS